MSKTVVLDLNRDIDSLSNCMSKTTRKYIRRSEENCSFREVIYDDSQKCQNDFESVMKIYHQTAERANFALHKQGYYYDVGRFMGDKSKLYVAATPDSDEIVAFLWNIRTLDCEFELYGGINEKGQSMKANYGLKFHAISEAKKANVIKYDINGLVSDGVSQFKMGFVGNNPANITNWCGTYDYPLNKFLYFLWEKLTLFIRGR